MENYNSNNDFEKYQKAKKQVEEIKGFYTHLVVYVLVMILLVFINLKYSPEHLWFIYSMSGWGLGLLGHASKVFGWFPFLGKDWEERKLKQFLEEEKKNQNKYQ
jgi:2TM domain